MPVISFPVSTLNNCIIGTKVQLRCGTEMWALLSNIDVHNPRSTEHFVTLSVLHQDEWIDLARYHDVDYGRRGPAYFAKALGLPPEDVFPITYDIPKTMVLGKRESLAREITQCPKQRLSPKELTDLATSG